MKIKILSFLILLLIFNNLWAAEWQWSVEIKNAISGETNSNPRAFLWIPSNCKQVRAVIVGQHNMCEETIFEHPVFRKTMADMGFAIIWITPIINQSWDVSSGCQTQFDTMLADLAEVSGYSELKNIPIVPLGHSALATFPWNFAAWNPERTLAVISYHGDAPRTNLTGYGGSNLEWGRTRNIDGIPGLMIEGEYEWWEARVNPALAFRMMYPESCISFLCDAGRGHFDVSDEVVSYISLFLKKAAQYRLPDNQSPDKQPDLAKINNQKGWLAQRWHPNQERRADTAPYAEYKGNRHDAFWYFDKEMAELTEKYYEKSRGKKDQYIGFVQNGQLLNFNEKSHSRYNAKFIPEEDGLTFHLSAVFTDSLHRQQTAGHSPKGKIKIDRINGPIKKTNDTTFMVQFYRMGLNNPKRTGDIWLIAHHDGDKIYKSAVQQINIRIPYPNKEGKKQHITFTPPADVKKGTKSISLDAIADSGLPVYYYVKEGPARIEGNKLIFTKMPPRAKLPLKVSVVAWQYGRLTGEKTQTAEAVERSFYIK
ncbi:hypothetical protein [Dysgonomonas sp. 511]|uniref:hypothetical protein n=1 Tax=Dysgonomonas sp. 511 TaxID=2302930 RepID=UPI0013D677BA|nr:hypothetical protein [Dysgonomonas sp. 511]NDV79162.1 hypothetical protein [Dysgonomonas sp. 511]